MLEAIVWPAAMKPSRSPIHPTNEREVAASPGTIRSLLANPGTWPVFHPGIRRASSLDGHMELRLGTRPGSNLGGQDVSAPVRELMLLARIT